MSYITNSDIEERLGHAVYVQLTDDTGTGLADEDQVEVARLAAEGEMNSHLGRRHAVPIDLSKSPELAGLLKGVALDLAAYRLHARRSPVPAEVKSRHDAAVRWLGRIAAGEAALPSAAELTANPVSGFLASATGSPRALTRAELEGL